MSFGLVWTAGEDSSSLIVLIGIFCSDYVFVIGHSDSCSLRKSGPFCHLLFMSISFGLLPLKQISYVKFALQSSTSLSYRFLLGSLLHALWRRY